MRRLLPALFALLATLCALPAFSQPFPTQTVHIVVPWPAGGSTDVLARALASELATLWGQPVVIDNVAGASSIIGTEKVVKSAPNGHTLLFTIDPTVVGNRFLFKKLPYDPDRSLAPVTMAARSGLFIVAHPSVQANSLRELIDMARKDQGKVAYSSVGTGSPPQLVMEALGKRENAKFLHVPYKGVAPATTAVVAGEVPVSVSSPAASGAMVKAGKIKALAITSPQRSKVFAEVPSVVEAGMPYAVYWLWFGLFAPGGTSPQLLERISRDATTVLKRQDFIDKHITPLSLELVANTPAEFAEAIRADVAAVGEMVKAAGVQPE